MPSWAEGGFEKAAVETDVRRRKEGGGGVLNVSPVWSEIEVNVAQYENDISLHLHNVKWRCNAIRTTLPPRMQ